MSEQLAGWLVVLAVVGLPALALAYAYAESRRRRRRLAKTARQLGLRFRPEMDMNIPNAVCRRFEFLTELKIDPAITWNAMEGHYRGHSVHVFDCRKSGYGKHKDTRGTGTVFLLEHALDAPKLHIFPEGRVGKLTQAMGFEDIDFESVEFSDMYSVACQDKEFAYAVCNAGVIELLLAHPGTILELEHGVVLMTHDRAFASRASVRAHFDADLIKPDSVQRYLDVLVDVREHIPNFVYSK